LTDTIELTIEEVDGDWLITKDDGKLKDITAIKNTKAADSDSEVSTETAVPDSGASTEKPEASSAN